MKNETDRRETHFYRQEAGFWIQVSCGQMLTLLFISEWFAEHTQAHFPASHSHSYTLTPGSSCCACFFVVRLADALSISGIGRTSTSAVS